MSVCFGVYLPQFGLPFEELVHQGTVAEDAGFDALWLMDHLTVPGLESCDTFEAWTTATVLAIRTSSIRVGHLVLSDPFRHPALLAKMAATLDVVSGGRLELGLGWGSIPAELSAFGFGDHPAAVRAGRLRETLEILDLMFAGESFDFDGVHYRLRGAIGRPVPMQAHVPIHIGGAGRQLTLPLVAQFADWWNCPKNALDQVAALRPLVGSARIGTHQPVALALSSASRSDVMEAARTRFAGGGGQFVGGNADEVAAALADQVELGVENFVIQFSDGGQPATLRTFMREVAPVVRQAAARRA